MIVLDIETTGLDPRKDCMLSLGAIDYDTGRSFYDECSIYPYTAAVDPVAMEINGMDIANHQPGVKQTAHALYRNFCDWANGFSLPTATNNILAGHNIGHFDILFLEELHQRHYTPEKFPFSYRTVDLHSLAFLVFGRSMKHSDICVALGLPPEPKPHNALSGAQSEANALRRIIERFNLFMFMSPIDFFSDGKSLIDKIK